MGEQLEGVPLGERSLDLRVLRQDLELRAAGDGPEPGADRLDGDLGILPEPERVLGRLLPDDPDVCELGPQRLVERDSQESRLVQRLVHPAGRDVVPERAVAHERLDARILQNGLEPRKRLGGPHGQIRGDPRGRIRLVHGGTDPGLDHVAAEPLRPGRAGVAPGNGNARLGRGGEPLTEPAHQDHDEAPLEGPEDRAREPIAAGAEGVLPPPRLDDLDQDQAEGQHTGEDRETGDTQGEQERKTGDVRHGRRQSRRSERGRCVPTDPRREADAGAEGAPVGTERGKPYEERDSKEIEEHPPGNRPSDPCTEAKPAGFQRGAIARCRRR